MHYHNPWNPNEYIELWYSNTITSSSRDTAILIYQGEYTDGMLISLLISLLNIPLYNWGDRANSWLSTQAALTSTTQCHTLAIIDRLTTGNITWVRVGSDWRLHFEDHHIRPPRSRTLKILFVAPFVVGLGIM